MRFILLLLIYFVPNVLDAQQSNAPKNGKVNPEDFIVNSSLLDTNTNAIILSDIGSSEFEANSSGWFTLIFRKHKRIKIINKNGFDAADISILLYTNDQNQEKVRNLKAYTHNLENGVVVTTELNSKEVFEQRLNKNYIEKKFTFPNVKPGCIIEFAYSLYSDFMFNLQSWQFEDAYPCLWSEYKVKIPDFFRYVFLTQGYRNYQKDESNDYSQRFLVQVANNSPSVSNRLSNGDFLVSGGSMKANQPYQLNTIIHENKWVMTDIPAIKKEDFLTTVNNHISKIEFQLAEHRFPQQPVKKIMADWKVIAEELTDRNDFGAAYEKSNNWIDDELQLINKGITDPYEKAEKIYNFIRDKFTCTRNSGVFLSDGKTVKDIFREKSGNTAEINLLLLAFLRKEKIVCNPVLLSLRNRGVIHPIYPLMDRFNYLIAEINIDGNRYFLDASNKYLGFGKLSAACYNGLGWGISNKVAHQVNLSSDSIMEYKSTNIFIKNAENEECWGMIKSDLGLFESTTSREEMKNKTNESLKKEWSAKIGTNYKILKLEVDSSLNLGDPLKFNVEISFNPEDDIIYLNPLFGEETKKNPFNAEKRQYPIEMPSLMKEVISLDMEIPKGYVIEEIPTSVRFFLNETEGVFEYIAVKKPDRVQIRNTIQIKKTVFTQEDYESLREFFTVIIQKQNEQVVFKKSK